MAKICPHCVSPLPHIHASHCPSCGTSLVPPEPKRTRQEPDDEDNYGETEMAKICPHCLGPLFSVNSSHCPHCGEKIRSSTRRK